MLVLITYDVNTEDPAGRKRLRQIARQCVNYGQRVQNSVFECMLDTAQCKVLQAKLLSIMDPERAQAPAARPEPPGAAGSSCAVCRRSSTRPSFWTPMGAGNTA